MKHFIKGFKDGLKYLGENINFLVNCFLFSIIYLIGVGLTSVFLKIFRKHLLELSIGRKTYWEKMVADDKEKNNYYNQF